MQCKECGHDTKAHNKKDRCTAIVHSYGHLGPRDKKYLIYTYPCLCGEPDLPPPAPAFHPIYKSNIKYSGD